MGSHQSPVTSTSHQYQSTLSGFPVRFFFQHKMLVSPSSLCLLMTLCMFCTMPTTIQGWPKREHSPTEQEVMEWLGRGYGPEDYTELEYRPKRRYGSKYDDNKSYGFWISALNKAGNYKRGKRSTPFVPA